MLANVLARAMLFWEKRPIVRNIRNYDFLSYPRASVGLAVGWWIALLLSFDLDSSR